jgi:RNA polymerase primary sigma factor
MLALTASEERNQETGQLAHRVGDFRDVRERTEALLRTEVDFIPNASFARCDPEADEAILASPEQFDRSEEADDYPHDLPAHLARLCEARLLSAEEERDLFRALNYVKYRVNVLRAKLDPMVPDLELVEKAETLLKIANRIRNRLVQANLRLVLSVVKKFATPQCSFDELLSDGITTLIQAVDKFDFDRGFRFSTYAYRAITRCAYRQVSARQKDASRSTAAVDEVATYHPEDSDERLVNSASCSELRGALDEMLSRLDRRERFIVRRRYGMGRSRQTATFQSMANKLGVSKERVRQLENRAVCKLRAMAAELGVSNPFE